MLRPACPAVGANSLRPAGPGRPETAEPAALGEGVSGGLGAVPLPVPLVAPSHTARPGRGSHRTPLPVPGDAPGPMQSRLLLLGAPGGRGGPAARRVRLLLGQVVRRQPGGDARRSEVKLLHAGAGADTGNPGTPRRPALRAGLLRTSAPPPAPPPRNPYCFNWGGALRRELGDGGSSIHLAANCCVTRGQAHAPSEPHVTRGNWT